MTYRQTCEIQNNNQVIITLPDQFKQKKKVRVIIEDLSDDQADKIKLLKQASKDPLFLADIDEIYEDFKNIDKELI